jgi:rsbT co-antagonist protein RsbR
MQLMTNEPESVTLRARVAALEGLLAEHERAAAAHAAQMTQLVAELSAKTRIFEAILRSIADGVIVCDAEGRFLHVNEAAKAMVGIGPTDMAAEQRSAVDGWFLPDGVTPYPPEELPLARAGRGEIIDGAEIVIRNANMPAGIWVEASTRSIRDEGRVRIGTVFVLRDITERKRHEMAIEQALATEREKNAALERLRLTVQALSTPILELWEDVLALPLIGVVDSRRAQEVMRQILEAVVEKQCRFVIIDVTGVDVLDSVTADHLLRMVHAIALLGAKTVLTGIRPPVAQTLVGLGAVFESLVTLRTLKHGLQACLRWKAGTSCR